MEFNKFDILSAYYLYGAYYHSGQGTKEYAYMTRALNAGFKPGQSFSFESLSNNGKRIYTNIIRKSPVFS